MRGKILASAIMCLLLISCNLFGPDEKITIQIMGVVTDANTNSPIVGVEVTLYKSGFLGIGDESTMALTDQQGLYYIKYEYKGGRCSDSLFHIVAYHKGYKYKLIWSHEEPHVRCTEDIQTINFQLEPEPRSYKKALEG